MLRLLQQYLRNDKSMVHFATLVMFCFLVCLGASGCKDQSNSPKDVGNTATHPKVRTASAGQTRTTAKNSNITIVVIDSSLVEERAQIELAEAERVLMLAALNQLKFSKMGISMNEAGDMRAPEIVVSVQLGDQPVQANGPEAQPAVKTTTEYALYWDSSDRGSVITDGVLFDATGLNKVRELVALMTKLKQ